MKKNLSVLAACAVLLLSVNVFAASIDVSSLSDTDLQILFENVQSELSSRGLSTKSITLREGKWIVGQDIQPGTYTITCLESDGESIGDTYASLGNAMDKLDDENNGYGDLFGALGGMIEDLAETQIKVLGDYGTELKSLTLKSGESANITLEEKTALEISGGKCELRSN